jgi:hypothetical protein
MTTLRDKILSRLAILIAALVVSGCVTTDVDRTGKTKAGLPAEGALKPFLGTPALTISQVHKRDRFPNIVVTVSGTLLAVHGNVMVKRSEDGGETWGPEILIGKGFRRQRRHSSFRRRASSPCPADGVPQQGRRQDLGGIAGDD